MWYKHLTCSLYLQKVTFLAKGNNTHTDYYRTWKQRSLSDGTLPSLQNNLSLLPGFCHFYLWQSVRRSPQRVTKPVTMRHFHSLSGKRQDISESAAPLSDMAVPKALPITAGKLEERSRWLYRDLFANKITGRHFPQGTIWLPHIPAFITPSPSLPPLFIDVFLATHSHTASCKTATENVANWRISFRQSIIRVTHVNTSPCNAWITSSQQSALLNIRNEQSVGSLPDLAEIARLVMTFFVIIWTLHLFLARPYFWQVLRWAVKQNHAKSVR